MPVSERQLAEFKDKHAWQIPFDTSPRHLAGPGDARYVTHGLAAAGWTRTSDPLSPRMVLTSPDHRYRLQYEPELGAATWWTLQADTEPYWYASLGGLVPAEVLAAVTDALIFPPPQQQPDPWQVVSAAGWRLDASDKAQSPDGTCHIELRNLDVDRPPAWCVETCEPGHDGYAGRLLWRVWFSDRIPAHLVNAFVTALTDTAPFQRGMHDQTAHYSVVQQPSPLTPTQVVEAHITRLDALRAQARADRRRQRLSTAKAPAPSSTAAPLRR
ncbi:DUF317 domain-containing protein [Streptomyces calvus]